MTTEDCNALSDECLALRRASFELKGTLRDQRDKAMLAVLSASNSIWYLRVAFRRLRAAQKGHFCDYRRMIDSALDITADQIRNLAFHPENNVYSSIVRERNEWKRKYTELLKVASLMVCCLEQYTDAEGINWEAYRDCSKLAPIDIGEHARHGIALWEEFLKHGEVGR
jgi:hypothetical protein